MSAPLTADLRLLAYQLGQAFSERRQLPELIAFAVATFRELLKAEGVAILLLDRENDELYIPYLAEQDPQVAAQLSNVRFPAYRGIAGKVLRTARSLRIDDAAADRWFFAGVDEKTQRVTRSVVCAPLISPHGALGVIEAVNPLNGERFSDADLVLLDALAETIAAAIDNVRNSPAAADASSAPRPADATGDREKAGDYIFRRQGEYWTISYEGETLRFRHAKGLAYMAFLLRHPGQEFHAIDLIAQDSGQPAGGSGAAAADLAREAATATRAARSLGDAGELLDPQARENYRRRLNELREELAEAHAFNDPGRADRVQQEIDFLTQELSRAVGLGGRDRLAGSHAERARVNVTRAIASVIQKITEHHADLGRHFTATIKTGMFCSYTPDPRVPLAWQL